MIKRMVQLFCTAGLLAFVAVASQAQSSATATQPPAQSSTAAAQSTPPAGTPAATTTAAAQQVPDGGVPEFLRPETPMQRLQRIGTAEDPGMNPDPHKVFWRFGKAYTIDRYDRTWAVYTGGQDENWIRPFGFANFYRELYQQNNKYVWVWQPVPEDAPPEEPNPAASTTTGRQFTPAEVEYLQYLRSDFAPLKVATSTKTIRFEEASEGLPTKGSWRNELAVADMNGDGFPDLIAPPERGGGTVPAIFLGDGKGHWTYWQGNKWPHALDYGGVAAADFNHDGHMDLAFAVHLKGIFVYLGDGKGNFTEVTEGLPRNFASRRLAVLDVDGDGWDDIVALTEGPTAAQGVSKSAEAKFRVYYNRKKGTAFEGVDIAPADARVAGDWFAVGRFNNDKVPDFVTANIYMSSTNTLYLSKNSKSWSVGDPQGGKLIPTISYYLASAAGKFSSKKTDDAIVSFVRFWPTDLNPKLIPKPPTMEITGIDRISFEGAKPVRTPITRWANKFGVSGMATGDFDGDGNLDIIYTNPQSANERVITILLGDGKGGFTQALTEGLHVEPQVTYDIKVADVNGDRRPDVIMMYESDEGSAFSPRTGSIHVFLNRGPAQPATH